MIFNDTAATRLSRLKRGGVLATGLALVLGMAAPAMAAPARTPAPAAKTTRTAAKAPAMTQLMTRGRPTAHQVSIKTNADQRKNAQAIINAGKALHLPPRAWVIAVATSLQETKLHNYGNLGHRNDHDSLGLFQQRPSAGWGTPKQVTNPTYAATAFYKALKHVHNYAHLPLTVAAQKVQVSAYPDRYAQWETEAANLVLAGYGQGPMAVAAK